MNWQKTILILGDQLSPELASLKNANKKSDRILMAEVQKEATYVWHHKKKIALVFSAMRHFAEELRSDGWVVDYVKLDDPDNTGSIVGELKRQMKGHNIKNACLTEPGEWRLLEAFRNLREEMDGSLDILPDNRFISNHHEFQAWADGRKQFRMEYFYRVMRKKTGLLMEDEEPVGGKWNYDHENRKPAEKHMRFPDPPMFEPDKITKDVILMVSEKFGDHFGSLDDFWFPVARDQAEELLDHFIANCLEHFGDFQDAMLHNQPFLFHSLLSPAINLGLLDPLKVCRQVEQAYKKGKIPLNSAEGFIRQIIGWREYMRGIYWLNMPDYIDRNYFGHDRDLPKFYWTGKTDMNCLSQVVTQTKKEAYAHHIQRLMVTGNFALLAGISPRQVHEWYLAVYADAYEWVELPNTLGMSQFADGGLLGSKPYVSSGNYINKMSDYCKKCRYNVSQKTGGQACPFNSLYWHFLYQNRELLGNNPRLGNPYRTWDKMAEDRKKEYLASAESFLAELK